MGKIRMAAGDYLKKLVQLPPEVVRALEVQAREEDRSVNGQLVHVLRTALKPVIETLPPPVSAILTVPRTVPRKERVH
jgi:hypothetical protein